MVKITVFISLLISFSFQVYAQNQLNPLNIDSVLLQSTLDTIHAKWHESELSLQNENAVLLWHYICSFDSLNIEAIQFDETLLLKAINAPFINDCQYRLIKQSWLKRTLSSIVIFKRRPFSFPKEYKILYCVDRVRIEVRVFDSESREIARYNGYEYIPINHVSDVYQHLHIRLFELKDKAIFSPNFPGYFVPYKWFGAITSDNQLVWYNIYEPRVSYSSKELFENHWNEFVISKH